MTDAAPVRTAPHVCSPLNSREPTTLHLNMVKAPSEKTVGPFFPAQPVNVVFESTPTAFAMRMPPPSPLAVQFVKRQLSTIQSFFSRKQPPPWLPVDAQSANVVWRTAQFSGTAG